MRKTRYWRFLVVIFFISLIAAVTSQAATDTGLYVEIRESDLPGAPVMDRWRLYGASHALVIGIDNYTNGWPRLHNAVKDAEAVAAELGARGFDVWLKRDLDSRALRDVLREFFAIKGEQAEARLLLWFAGHGHTIGGEGFLVPADAPPPTDPRFKLKALHMRDFGGLVRLAQAKHVLNVFDACFSGTIFRTRAGIAPAPITRKTTRPVRQFVTSGEAGQQVRDDGSFRKLFLRAIRGEERADFNGDRYVTGEELGLFLSQEMAALTETAQTPQYGKLQDVDYTQGDFVFKLPSQGDVLKASAPAMTAEIVFWESIKGSTNPRMFEAYLEQHPNGAFAALARAKLEELKGGLIAALSEPSVATAIAVDEMDLEMIAVKNANVRAGPSTSFDRVTTLRRGARITATGKVKDADWYRVALAGGGDGFVFARLLEEAVVGPESAPLPSPPGGDPSRVILDSGLTLADWVLLAEDRLTRGDYVSLVVEANQHQRRHGAFSEVQKILYAALLSDVRAREGLDKVERAASYRKRFGAVPGLEKELDAATNSVLADLKVYNAATARAALTGASKLEVLVGPSHPVLALQARAHHLMKQFDRATSYYQRWLRVASTDNPQRKQMAVGLLKARNRQELWPQVGETFTDCQNCPEMVVVPAGSFLMGSPPSEEFRASNEDPQHGVTIPSDIAVGKYEVTFKQWEACLAAGECNGYRPPDQDWGRGQRPVINVSWLDAKAYVDWLSRRTGNRYRLLSEAEWEYAARAGTTTPFSTGRTITTVQANFDGNYTYGGSAKGVDRGKTLPVGSFSANGFGLHDVHGNVWELLEDCWHGNYAGAPTDGRAWTSGGDCDRRVLHGGSWLSTPENLRSAIRIWFTTGSRYNYFGFRVARTLD